ncbi:MAG: FAD-dependent oxidoreductase [Armatimonadota bacterium]|nr:FAD-dependent oxidoreductase [bacterium]
MRAITQVHKYIIAGGGLTGASAIDGIRELDKDGSILLIGSEQHKPYDRPPLTKKLWFGKKTVEQIFVHDDAYYHTNGVDLALGVEVTHLDVVNKIVETSQGGRYHYEKLLLATGGVPRRLGTPGGELDGLFYYRYLDDYLKLRSIVSEDKKAVAIGGGFIGSEMAAALNINGVEVTIIFPGAYLVDRVFPEDLGQAVQREFVKRGVRLLTGNTSTSIEASGGEFITRTDQGHEIMSDAVVVGVGIVPSTALAEAAGLAVSNGIVVNDYLQTSNLDIYAAGDNTRFYYQVLGKQTRVEHWDNALNQGKQAGRNMAGASEPYTYMPYFFSDLFDFGYEAVGDVDSRLEVFEDWQDQYTTGVVYYLEDHKVRGAMMCNVWDKVPAARELIQSGRQMTTDDLRGAIH